MTVEITRRATIMDGLVIDLRDGRNHVSVSRNGLMVHETGAISTEFWPRFKDQLEQAAEYLVRVEGGDECREVGQGPSPFRRNKTDG